MDTNTKKPKRLWDYLREGLIRARKRRPVSARLIPLIFLMILLTASYQPLRENPRQFALILTLNIIFFIVIAFRALWDMVEILKQHFSEREGVLRETLGDETFLASVRDMHDDCE